MDFCLEPPPPRVSFLFPLSKRPGVREIVADIAEIEAGFRVAVVAANARGLDQWCDSFRERLCERAAGKQAPGQDPQDQGAFHVEKNP